MALMDDASNGNGLIMPVAPMGGAYSNGGDGFFGGNGIWFLILFILLGGWGNGFGGGYGNGGGMNGMYPWMNQSNQINDGFRDQMIAGKIDAIGNNVVSGFGDVQNSLCSGFAGVNASIANAQSGIAQQMYTNQISDLERSFAAQTANAQGMSAIQSQLANCCCDQKYATAQLQNVIQTEACADRAAVTQALFDVTAQNNANTQKVLDKLCALELDGVKNQLAQAQRENVGLQNQLNMANLAASQTAQNALIQQGFSNEVDALYNRLNSCPVPTTPVYGRTPIFTCGGNGTGCSGNSFIN